MTISEMRQRFPVYVYRPSAGETIFTVCLGIYRKVTDQHLAVLKALNRRYDWSCLQANAPISYIANEHVKHFEEL